jgi:hypothetical protein
MRVKYDLLSTTISKNLVFNKPKERIQKSKFNDNKCSFCYHGYVLVHNAINNIGCFLKFHLKVRVEKSIVNALRITDDGSAV